MDRNKQMRRIWWVLGLWMIASVASVYGQSDVLMTVNIPFAFSVGNKTLAADEYTIERLGQNRGDLMFRSADGRASRIFLAITDDTEPVSDENRLVFHQYGDRYFLSQVWCGPNHSLYELLPSRAEREAAKEASEPRYHLVSLTASR